MAHARKSIHEARFFMDERFTLVPEDEATIIKIITFFDDFTTDTQVMSKVRIKDVDPGRETFNEK